MPKNIRLDAFRYITNEAWRALTAVEMGLKNHEVVPLELVQKISRSRRSGSGFIHLLKDQLIANCLVAYEKDTKKSIFGYRLTNLGYDYLALHQFFISGQLSDVGCMIGTGKESDVYLAIAGDKCGQLPDEDIARLDDVSSSSVSGSTVVIKFHRLGRTSFRKVKEKRDYHQHRNTCSWLYLDRLASQREFTMMKVLQYTNKRYLSFQALHGCGLSVPVALAHNRNAVVMSYVNNAVPLYRVLPIVLRASDGCIAKHLYSQAKHLLYEISAIGLVHGDFNEFNLMVVGLQSVDIEELNNAVLESVRLVLIDFPQMISRDHSSAGELYQRDADGVVSFFSRFFDIPDDQLPHETLDYIERRNSVDVEVKAPGYPNKQKPTHCPVRTGSVDEQQSSENASGGEESTSCESKDQDSSSCSDSDSGGQLSEEQLHPATYQHNAALRTKLDKALKNMNLSEQKSKGLIDVNEIRVRHRRERRKQEQFAFQKNIKRHTRAKTKRQERANLKAELTLFG